jgi:hypothetical protein
MVLYESIVRYCNLLGLDKAIHTEDVNEFRCGMGQSDCVEPPHAHRADQIRLARDGWLLPPLRRVGLRPSQSAPPQAVAARDLATSYASSPAALPP